MEKSPLKYIQSIKTNKCDYNDEEETSEDEIDEEEKKGDEIDEESSLEEETSNPVIPVINNDTRNEIIDPDMVRKIFQTLETLKKSRPELNNTKSCNLSKHSPNSNGYKKVKNLPVKTTSKRKVKNYESRSKYWGKRSKKLTRGDIEDINIKLDIMLRDMTHHYSNFIDYNEKRDGMINTSDINIPDNFLRFSKFSNIISIILLVVCTFTWLIILILILANGLTWMKIHVSNCIFLCLIISVVFVCILALILIIWLSFKKCYFDKKIKNVKNYKKLNEI